MTIDPRIYRKYGGRSGDPMTRMGEALAESSARRQANADMRDRISTRGFRSGWRRFRLISAATVAIIVVIVLVMNWI